MDLQVLNGKLLINGQDIFENANKGDFEKPVRGKVLFEKVSPSSIKIPAGFSCKVGATSITVEVDQILTVVDTATKGVNYLVYASANGSFFLDQVSDSNTGAVFTNRPDDRLIGGFHYSLVPDNEAPTGNKKEADMVKLRGINAYSMWDLKFNEGLGGIPLGKTLCSDYKWSHIYPADVYFGSRGYCVSSGTMAAGDNNATYGRGYPVIPAMDGGNGTATYESLDWFESQMLMASAGMELPMYKDYQVIAYGVQENISLAELVNISTYAKRGKIDHIPQLMSKWGVEQATGVQYFWGGDIGNFYGTTTFAWNNTGTGGRGGIYATANSPAASRLSGYELNDQTSPSGSRYVDLSSYVWNSYWVDGVRGCCDHKVSA